jgi:hypothetical protein
MGIELQNPYRQKLGTILIFSNLLAGLEPTERRRRVMRISARRLGVAAVIDINAPIEGRAGGGILVGVREQIRAGYELVVLNLERVPSVDLAGLGTLVESFVAMRKSGGQLRLAGITQESSRPRHHHPPLDGLRHVRVG